MLNLVDLVIISIFDISLIILGFQILKLNKNKLRIRDDFDQQVLKQTGKSLIDIKKQIVVEHHIYMQIGNHKITRKELILSLLMLLILIITLVILTTLHMQNNVGRISLITLFIITWLFWELGSRITNPLFHKITSYYPTELDEFVMLNQELTNKIKAKQNKIKIIVFIFLVIELSRIFI